MRLVVCPGMHEVELTHAFLQGMDLEPSPSVLVLPTQTIPPYDAPQIVQFLHTHLGTHYPSRGISQEPLLWIGFSAGVVGAIAAAHLWQLQGGSTQALIAFDGWGVPLFGNFPLHRLSHDSFTHWSSVWLGGGEQMGFYADPPVEHLELWRSPQTTLGWPTPHRLNSRSPITAAECLRHLLQHYGLNPPR